VTRDVCGGKAFRLAVRQQERIIDYVPAAVGSRRRKQAYVPRENGPARFDGRPPIA
jgi:hypothetical protein